MVKLTLIGLNTIHQKSHYDKKKQQMFNINIPSHITKK